MINLELSAEEEQLIAEVHRQSRIYRTHSERFDKTLDHTIPPEVLFRVEGEEAFPHVRNAARASKATLSAYPILDALITLEECWGPKPFWHRYEDADGFDHHIQHRLIRTLGTPEQIERWTGSPHRMAWGMTEPSGGSDPASMKTVAKWSEASNAWILNGEKTFISFATAAHAIIVLARAYGAELDGVVTPFIVPRDCPGLTVGPQMEKLGILAQDVTGVHLQDCAVPDDHRLRGNLRSALEMFNGLRGPVGGQALGFARAALDIVRDVLMEQGIDIDYASSPQHRSGTVDRFMKLEELYESSWLTMVHAVWQISEGGADQYPSLSKFVCGGAARKITRGCIELLGQSSTDKTHLLERLVRDARIYDIYGGAGNVLRLFIARWLLGLKKSELN